MNFFKGRVNFYMIKNFINIFHIAIIAVSLLVFSGCGYKSNPVYEPNNNQEKVN